MIDLENRDWRQIAEQASTETNPSKMMILVRQLCEALDREKVRVGCDGQRTSERSPFART
jgi:hypothetical protein